MIRYERTGEYRQSRRGEFFEHVDTGSGFCRPTLDDGGFVAMESWILRRVESPGEPAAARPNEAPEPDYRDGEQTANVVRTLVWAASVTDGQTGHSAACFREAIRRVKAHEKAREYVTDSGAYLDDAARAKLLALLDADAGGEA